MSRPSPSFDIVLSEKAKRREPSAIRELAKLLQDDSSILSLGAGTPNYAAVPICSISFEARVGGSCFESNPNKSETVKLTASEQLYAVSYSPTPGIYPLLQRLRNITIGEHMLSPEQCAPDRLSLMVGTGSQSLLAKALDALCNPGDAILVDEATYPGTLAILQGVGVVVVPVATDSDGMIPSALVEAMESWPKAASDAWNPTAKTSGSPPEVPKPRAVYLIPNGSNPTGITMPLERRTALYEAAQSQGLFIVEDDPYYWLRYTAVEDLDTKSPTSEEKKSPRKSEMEGTSAAASGAGSDPTFGVVATHELGASKSSTDGPLAQLPDFLPSLLHLDSDGRVLHLESFSKVIAGGLRMGFACGPRQLLERMELDGQASDLHASGMSQAMLCAMLRHWGAGNGPADGAAAESATGRASAEHRSADAKPSSVGRSTAHLGRFEEHIRHVAGLYRSRCNVFLKHARRHLPMDKIQLQVPQAGMFYWIKTSLKDTREFVKVAAEKSKVLILPGSVFAPKAANGTARSSPYVRASFSSLSEADTEEALRRLGECFRESALIEDNVEVG